MPVVAAYAIYSGAAALAGGVLTGLQTIAAIGSIVGGIGALTGNKTMMKVGAVAGLAGGIGQFAADKGWLASADSLQTAADSVEGGTAASLKATPSGAEVNMPVDPDVGGAAGASSGAVATPVPEAGPMQTANLEPATSISNSVGQQNTEVAKALGAAPAETVGGAAESAGSGLMDATLKETFNAAKDSQAASAAIEQMSPMENLLDAASSGKRKILDLFDTVFRDKDGKLNKDMLSLAGNFVGGMFDKSKAAQAEFLEERAATEREQRANANAVPTLNIAAQRKPAGTFRPASPTYRPVRPVGLMNAR